MKKSDGTIFKAKGKGKCAVCGGLISEGDQIALNKLDNEKWERAHLKCAQSDGADQSSYIPQSPAPSLNTTSTADQAMSKGIEVHNDVLKQDDEGYTKVIDMDCHLHLDPELREQFKEFKLFMESVSKRMQSVDEQFRDLKIDLVSSANRQAAAQEEVVKVLKNIHDIYLKFGQK